MNTVNIEVYSIVILTVLLFDYIAKFKRKFNTASLLWMTLTISTILIAISNIFLTLSDLYVIRVISILVYLLNALISSLFVYLYVKYIYIYYEINLKKELMYTLISILVCTVISLHYVFNSTSDYIIHSFNRMFFNRLLILAIIPNISVCILYIAHALKNKIALNYKIVFTLLLTVIGLTMDILSDTLFFVTSAFTLTSLIFYINKKDKLLNTDPLTGLSNKRSLEEYLINMKRNIKVALYNIDIDKFKAINDTYGHAKGDMILKIVADILRNSSRISDLVIRNGGDEFLIISEIKNEEDVKKIMERISLSLANYNKESNIKVSLSIGWGLYSFSENNTLEEFSKFLKEVDNNMYKEKAKKYEKIKKNDK